MARIVVIGAGDATAHRILPALHEIGYQRDEIAVVSLAADSHTLEELAQLTIHESEGSLISQVLADQAPAIIASPTDAHYRQMSALADAGRTFAVEKPVVQTQSEVALLRGRKHLLADGFSLSYYTLEKALPLTALYRSHPAFRSQLEGATLDAAAAEIAALGALRRVQVELLEGFERSPHGLTRLWTELPGNLYPFVETCIHPLLVLRTVLPSTTVRWQRLELGRYEPRAQEIRSLIGREIAPTFVHAVGAVGPVEIDFQCGKYIAAENTGRRATLSFERGATVCDFDRRRLELPSGAYLQVPPERPNYGTQLRLVQRFFAEGWQGERFDDYANQLDALEWWGLVCSFADEQQIPVSDYA